MHTCIYALHALEWKGQEAVWEKQAEGGEKKEKEKKKAKGTLRFP